jgi:prepilin signal peptidase PulO-like enzyme (type II secretory pathway)
MNFSELGEACIAIHKEGYAIVLYFFIAWFGACWGSFIQACFYRIPLGISIVHPPSACPNCKHALNVFDNQPIIGWLSLKGRCRYCNIAIPLRYLGVEIFCLMLATGLAYVYFQGLLSGAQACELMALGLLFLLLAKIDCAYGVLPDGLVCMPLIILLLSATSYTFQNPRDLAFNEQAFGLIVKSLALGWFTIPAIRGSIWILLGAQAEERWNSLLNKINWAHESGEPTIKTRLFMSVLWLCCFVWFTSEDHQNLAAQGLAIGWALMTSTGWIGKKLNQGREALGMGDIKLVALLGYLVTSTWVLPMLGIACCLGCILALMRYGIKLKTEIPFGPCLCLSAWLVLCSQYLGWA